MTSKFNAYSEFRGKGTQAMIFQPSTKSCNKAVINRDGDLLFVSSGNEVYGYNLFTQTCFRVYEGNEGIIEDIDIDPKSQYLLSVGAHRQAFIHDIESGNVILQIDVNKMLRCCCFGPANLIAFVTSTIMKQEPTLYVYHIANGKAHQKGREVRCPSGINCITFSSDNTLILGDVSGKLYLVSIADKEFVFEKTVDAHRGAINMIRKSWDNKFFATASADTTACTWDMRSFEKLGTFPHSFLVSSVAISPIANHIVLASSADKKNVASTNFGSTDFTINFFRLIFSEEFASMKVFKSPVNDVVFTPDGMTLAVTSQEGTFMIIRLGDDYRKTIKHHEKEEEEFTKLAEENY